MNLSKYELLIRNREDYEAWLAAHDYSIALAESRLVTESLRELLALAQTHMSFPKVA